MAQVGLDLQTRHQAGSHIRIENLVTSLAQGFGPIHGRICIPQHVIRVLVGGVAEGNPDARRSENFFPAEYERRCQYLHEPVRSQPRVARIFKIIEQDREFVSAQARHGERFSQARDRICHSQALLQSIGHGEQELISNQVAQAVVDHLESIEVQEENRKQMIFSAFRVFDQASESINEQKPIGQARQWVRHLSFGNVGLRSGHARGHPGSVANGEPSAQHPAKGPVFVQHAMLALEMRGQSFLMGGELFFHSFTIRVMNSFKPFFRPVPDFIFVEAQHGFPAWGEITWRSSSDSSPKGHRWRLEPPTRSALHFPSMLLVPVCATAV